MTTFSVIVPTYNRPTMLTRAIRSVLLQTFSDVEIIIINDASMVDYSDALSSFNDCRIQYFEESTNRGQAYARNLGIARARGKYIALLDDDDEYPPDFLLKTFDCLESSASNIAMSFCTMKCIHYRDNRIESISFRSFKPVYPSTEAFFLEFLAIGTNAGVTFKKSHIQQLGLFDEKFKTTEDTDIFFRMLDAGFLPTIVPDVQMIIHHHEESRITDASHYRQRMTEYEWMLDKYQTFFRQYPTIKESLENNLIYLKREYLKHKHISTPQCPPPQIKPIGVQ